MITYFKQKAVLRNFSISYAILPIAKKLPERNQIAQSYKFAKTTH